MSIGPSSSSAACARRRLDLICVRDVSGETRACPPRSSISRAAASRPLRPRARRAIFAPSCANLRAVARPMPPEAPVMTTSDTLLDLPTSGEAKPLAGENLHCVPVAQLVLPADLLPVEAG